MNGILGNLKEGDRFNIITFSSKTKMYKKEMSEVNDNSIRKVQKYLKEKVHAHGGKLYYINLSACAACLFAFLSAVFRRMSGVTPENQQTLQ